VLNSIGRGYKTGGSNLCLQFSGAKKKENDITPIGEFQDKLLILPKDVFCQDREGFKASRTQCGLCYWHGQIIHAYVGLQ